MRASTIAVFCTYILLLLSAPSNLAIEWEMVSPYPTWGHLTSVASRESIVVAGGETGIVYSEDGGVTWARVNGRDAVTVTDLKYGNGVFVATSLGNGILRSIDGKKWFEQEVGLTSFYCLVFGNGLFVAGAADGSVATSSDGATWKLYPKVGAQPLNLAAYGNGQFVLKELGSNVGADGKQCVVISTDGVTWTRKEASGIENVICAPPMFPPPPFPQCAFNYQMIGLVYANDAFYARVRWFAANVNEAKYFRSSDGMTWTVASADARQPYPSNMRPSYPGPSDLRFVDGRFFQLGGFSKMYPPYETGLLSSTDLMNWTTNVFEVEGAFALTDITTSGNSYVVVGAPGLILRGQSLDALKRIDGPDKKFDVVTAAVHGDTIVAAGNVGSTEYPYPLILVSTNGGKRFMWANPSAPNLIQNIARVRYLGGKFVSVGNSGEILYSTNGVDWAFWFWGGGGGDSRPELYDVAFGGNAWVAVGYGGAIRSSTNGVDFEAMSSGTTTTLRGVAYGKGIFVAVSGSGEVLVSTNAVDWTISTRLSAGLSSIAFGDGRFVTVAFDGKAFVSTDAIDWTMHQAATAPLGRVAFAHGVFAVVVKNQRFTYFSTDGGLTWNRRMVYSANVHDVVEGNGILWLCGANVAGPIYPEYNFGPFIFREREDSPVTLSSGLEAAGVFKLRLDSMIPANYRIYSAENVTGPWDSREVLTNAIGEFSWRETNPAAIRFYKVGQE
jgi:hypothetical protein